MGIMLVLDISTAHLPPNLAQTLHLEAHMEVAKTEYGYWVHVPDRPGNEEDGYGDVPPEIVAVQLYARERGCWYIRFDADSDEIDALPTWEW